MFEVLTFIAVWCGNPAYQRSSATEVVACRANLLACLGPKPDKVDSVTLTACAVKFNVK